jgi:serine/threonine protein kinase
MKESPDGNKVFYMEDDIEFELLKKIGEGGFCKVYKAIGTYC